MFKCDEFKALDIFQNGISVVSCLETNLYFHNTHGDVGFNV